MSSPYAFVKRPFVSATTQETLIADETLMLAFNAGEAPAFDELYRRYRDKLYRFLLRQTNHNETVAIELYREVWLKVIQQRGNYRVQILFRIWLFHIAHNRLLDYYRAAGRRHEWKILDSQSKSLDGVQSGLRFIPFRQLQNVCKNLLANLPALQREVFLLKEEAGLSVEQIAEVFRSERAVIKSRLAYALNKLRVGFREDL